MSQQVIIFDTTLRDGEQSLQASLNVKEKLQIAFALERLGVDIMEVGFPISSPGDFESVRAIAKQIKNSLVCALARCVDKDIDIAAEALRVAKNFRIHIFLPTSSVHIQSKLNKNFNQIIEMTVHAIHYARKYTDDIEFSCEDAGRTTIDNLCRIVEIAIQSGANTINIPDTVGYTTPSQFGQIIASLYNRVPIIDKAIISVHCHDDLGMAVGNAISAIQAGARQIEGTINGIGERAGNTALEEVIMAIKVREDLLNVHTNIRSQEIYRTSQVISQLCNMPIPANKAIVGSNAFSHSSGIHQDGILKNRRNYEIMTPESIGLKDIKLNLTSRSGRAAVKYHMQAMGYQESDYDMDKLYDVFLELADKKGQVFDYDLEALAFINNQQEQSEFFRLKCFNVHSSSSGIATALVKLYCGENICAYSATGNGPIDAIYEALTHITKLSINLEKYQLNAKGHGRNALGQVDIVVSYEGRNFHGVGLDTDVIESSVKAMIHVLNNIWRAKQVIIQRKYLQKDNH
ncbi:2-isopropylmalate synthase [Blochmannia endosymbiont of Camponotus sp.]|uniref:2-isopropylmalate synthase n=1 Tax=Blochmannia endosymbiont of Camponotus sp. TaxID=700220 RepID=UPI002023FF65|nr:2-isopropylmalate synthase [Blochmannia endosymbiont of Camponotus sp.]URJ30226.1 2-isopropylmalate synthase [Blochmannia endosymbiont of Camponotus sp.]URJ31427.1 2-isopropylmalate synthase [Blochmannia endosymbiont of Camponotus sp.]